MWYFDVIFGKIIEGSAKNGIKIIDRNHPYMQYSSPCLRHAYD
jgi:hypothetical protein